MALVGPAQRQPMVAAAPAPYCVCGSPRLQVVPGARFRGSAAAVAETSSTAVVAVALLPPLRFAPPPSPPFDDAHYIVSALPFRRRRR